MKPRLLLLATIILGAVLLVLPDDARAQSPYTSIIENETLPGKSINSDLHFFDQKDAVLRYREVRLNNSIKTTFALNADDMLLLNLFENTTYTAKIKSIEENVMGTVVITADLIESNHAFAIISTHGDRTLVNISIPETNSCFQIISDPVTLNHFLIELNKKLMRKYEEYPSLIPPPPSAEVIKEQERIKKELQNIKSGPYDPANIDVLVVFTQAARSWANISGGGIFNRVATAMATAQLVLSNSETVMTMKLVHASEISYTESGDAELDLDRFTNTGDGHMDIVHTWRNTYGADLCQLYSTMGGGIGWVLNTSAGNPAIGFSISGIGATTSYTPIHEMGHNMGCGHHKEQNFQPGPGLFDFSAGWRWTGSNGVRYCDLMTYESGTYFPDGLDHSRVPHFSNPTVNYWNVPTGDAVDGDNAWTLMQVKHAIAAYRTTATLNCLQCPAYNIAMEPNNNWNTHSSSIVSNGCFMYRVNVIAGHTYTFQTGCGNGATANFDTYLTLYNSNCSIEATNDDGCESNRSKIEWMASYTGYAYLKVSGWSSASGNYTLAFHRGDDIEWIGQYSTNWNYAANWSGNVVPDNTFDVTIPDVTSFDPNVYLANAECKSLTVESGAILNMGSYNLVVSNDVNIHGTLNQNSTSSKLYVYGDIFWQSGSAATTTGSATIYVNGIWEFMNGANVYLTSGYVDFFGSGVSYIRSKDADSHFNHIRNNKAGTILGHSGSSLYPCRLNGNLYIYTNCELRSYTSQSFHIGNFVNNMSGKIELDHGTFVFDGSSGTSHFMPGDYFNNVTISSSGTTTFDDDIEIRGNLLIESGALSLGSTTLTLKGNWTNNVGTTGFLEGSSRVIFNGSGHQYVNSNETFNILEANMGAALRVENVAYTVTCSKYDWTAGGIDVIAGTFTALDLADNGLYGGYWVNPGGTINLTNSGTGTWVDLVGQIYNYGGTMNITGTSAWWPYNNNANLTMTGGVIDIKTCGIYMPSGYNSATYNITGGTIRTPYSFSGNDGNFEPTAGTFEFYGSGDYMISQSNGSTLHHVEINKSAKGGAEDIINNPVYDERSGEFISEGGKANNITLNSDFTITGNLDINAGTFNLGAYSCNVSDYVSIYGTLAMTNAANDLTATYINWYSGSDDNVTAGTFHANVWKFWEGTNAKLGTGNTAYLTGLNYPTDDDAEFGNLVAGPFAKLSDDEDGNKAFYPVRVAGNFTLQNTAWNFTSSGVDVIVQGNADIQSGSSLYFSAGNDFIVDGTLNLAGTLSLWTGSAAAVEGELTFPSTGWLSLNQATFTNNFAVSAYTYLYGKLTMNDNSILEFPGRSIYIGGSFVNEVSGGTLRFGRTLNAPEAGNFQLDFGTAEFFSANSNHFISVHNGNYLNEVVIDKTSVSLLLLEDLVVKKDIEINSGVFYASDKTISIGGDWTNNGGTSAFNAVTSQVIFNGTGALNHQFVNGNTNFYNVENAKSGGGYLRFVGNNAITNDFLANGENIVDGPTLDVNNLLLSTGVMGLTAAAPAVTVNNFTMGGYLSVTNGNFTCTDITNNGIFGTIDLYNGNITLNQVGFKYTDLNGTLNIHGGTLTVIGNHGHSLWGYLAPASLTMSGGILNFNNPGIEINDNYTISTSVSGGIIRTSGHFWVAHPNFVPTGGTAELYGNDPVWIRSSDGSHFYNLRIDKSASLLLGGDNTTVSGHFDVDMNNSLEKDRITFEPPSGRSGNEVLTNGNLKVINNTVVDQGSLKIVHEATNTGNLTVNSGGALVLENLGSLSMGSGKSLTVNNGGELALQGNVTDFPKITRISGNYALNIESGASIGAEYAIFEYMNASGVNVKAGAVVDPAKSFSNCILRNGQSGGRLLMLNNNQSLLLSGISFPGSAGNFNVSKTVNSGVVVLTDYSGSFGIPANEQDTYNRIHWTGSLSPTVTLDGVVIGSGQDICFEALQTITVGGAESFVVESGGNADLVAGQNIRMLEGTHIHSGAYLHAWISTSGIYCGSSSSLLAAMEEKNLPISDPENSNRQSDFRVFPNPTSGIFTLELIDTDKISTVECEVYDLMGKRIWKQQFPSNTYSKIDLTEQQPGIYFIRVMKGPEVKVKKLVLN